MYLFIFILFKSVLSALATQSLAYEKYLTFKYSFTTFSKHSLKVGDEILMPDEKTMFSHNDFTLGESSTESKIHSVGILPYISLNLFTSPLNNSSAPSKIEIKSSQGELSPPLVRAELKVFVDSVDFITCSRD